MGETEIECRDCDGEGEVEHPHLQGGYISPQAECPPDPVMIECEACNGKGWRAMTEDEADAAAEAAWDRAQEGEPPITMQERYEAAWKQKQELRR